jgi:hypothetical protein
VKVHNVNRLNMNDVQVLNSKFVRFVYFAAVK